jgi:integrase
MAYGQGSVHYDKARRMWVGAVELEPGPDGRRRRKFFRVKGEPGRRSPALETLLGRMAEAQVARDRGEAMPNERGTVGHWLDHWLSEVVPASDVAPATLTGYSWACRCWLVPYLGRLRLARLTPEHIEKMFGAMRDKGLTPGTITQVRMALRLSLKTAEARGHVARNVATLTQAPKRAGTKLDDALDVAEASAVLAAAKGDRLEALAVVALGTGLRQGEVLALRWADVDLEAPSLTVTKAKTPSGVRTIALPPFVASALREHRRRQAAERLAAPVWEATDLVFTTPVGSALQAQAVRRWWYALTIGAGVGRRRFHASRHSAATLMLNAGTPLEVVSATLGHAGLAITADVYAKVRPELQRKAADAMEQVLGAGGAK